MKHSCSRSHLPVSLLLLATLGSSTGACSSIAPVSEPPDDGPSDEGMGGLGGAGGEKAVDANGNDACDGSCSAQETCCHGICVDLERDVEHCGACDSACSPVGGVAACELGECTVSCSEGHLDCDTSAKNGCEVADPGSPADVEVLRPLLGAASGSLITAEKTGALRPTFTWTPAPAGGCAEVTYELQVDDSCPVEGFADCAFESPEIDELVVEPTYTPTEDLPVSLTAPVGTRYTWRVRVCDDLERCSAWRVGYVDVGRDRQDVNGDGYADIVVQYVTTKEDPYVLVPGGPELGVDADGAPSDIAVSLVFNQSGEIVSLNNPPVIRFVGDVNGDGFQDFVADGADFDAELLPNGVLTPDEVIDCPTRFLYLGGAEFTDMKSRRFSTNTWAPSTLAHNFAAGDFDGDGYADVWAAQSAEFVPGDGTTPDHEPRVFLFRGRPDVAELPVPDVSGSSTADFSGVWKPSWSIEARPDDNGDRLGISVEPGDFNGDGHIDAAIVAPAAHRVYLVLGGGEATFVARAIPYGGSDVGPFDCRDVRLSVADLNADGFDDFALNCDEQHLIEGYYGGDPLPDALAFSELVQPEAIMGLYDTLAADLDGDGRVDLITSSTVGIGEPPYPTVSVFPGTFFQGNGGERLSLSVAPASGYFGAADHNGDGFTDLVKAGASTTWIPGNGSLDYTEESPDGRAPIPPRPLVGIVGNLNTKSVGR